LAKFINLEKTMSRLKLSISALLLAACSVLPSAAQQSIVVPSSNTVVPAVTKFAGVLMDGNGKPVSGITGVTFSLYKDEQGGAALWVETQNVNPDKNGHYSVVLGSTAAHGLPSEPFASGEARWLGVQAQGHNESPRVLLTSVPYALKAADAQTLGGMPASAFLKANANGSKLSSNGPANSSYTGTGKAHYIPLWLSPTKLGDSQIFQSSAGNLGLGTTTPATTLDVNGAADFRNTLTLFPSGTSPALALSGTAFGITNTGLVNFVSGQTFPGAGTISGVTAGIGLTGGGTSGNVTLNIDTTKVPQLATANTFTNNQVITGNLTTSGIITGGIASFSGAVAANAFALPSTTGAGTGVLSIAGSPFFHAAGGTSNLWVGNTTGNFATTGTFNTGVGYGAGGANTTGTQNTFVGSVAGASTTTGYDNTAVGTGAGKTNTTGFWNTFLGIGADANSGNLSNATAIGFAARVGVSNALVLGGTGSSAVNVGIGTPMPLEPLTVQADDNGVTRGTPSQIQIQGSSDPTKQLLVGYLSDGGKDDGFGSIQATHQSVKNTSLSLNPLGGNVGIGTTAPGAGLDVNGTANFRGIVSFASGQTFPGVGTITGITAGTDLTGGGSSGGVTLNLDTTKVPQLNTANAFIGNQSVTGNLTSSGIISGGIGSFTGAVSASVFALPVTTSSSSGVLSIAGSPFFHAAGGTSNTWVGNGAGNFTTTGTLNTGLGNGSGTRITTGMQNTFVGVSAGAGTTTGANNIFMGTGAGGTNATGSGNTFVGVNADAVSGNLINATAIGLSAKVAASNALVLGGTGSFAVNVGIGTPAPVEPLTVQADDNGVNRGTPAQLEIQGSSDPTKQLLIGYLSDGGSDDGYGAIQATHDNVKNTPLVLNPAGAPVLIGTKTSVGNPLQVGQGLGLALADGWATYSSRRWKTNIQTLHGALDKVEELRGVSYDLKSNGKHEVGVIAEEVGAVVPEIVQWEKNGKDAAGVDYSRLTALLIEAVKEQQTQIKQERAEIAKTRIELRRAQALLRTQAAAVKQLKAEIGASRLTSTAANASALDVRGVAEKRVNR
jgi:hypothetical protein